MNPGYNMHKKEKKTFRGVDLTLVLQTGYPKPIIQNKILINSPAN